MCDHDGKLPSIATTVQQQLALEEPIRFNGSHRRRLWELSHECHRPVVGVCIPKDTLRRIVNVSRDHLLPSVWSVVCRR